MTKRIFALLLVLAMALTAIGCGEKKPADDNTVVSDFKGPLTKFDETVTLTTVMSSQKDLPYAEGEDQFNNMFIDLLKEKLNIKLTYKYITDSLSSKINFDIVTGDLADVMMVSRQQMEEMVKADLIMELDELFTKAASDDLKATRAANEESYLKINGKLYGVPNLHFGNIGQVNTVWIRQDWMDELDLDAPETMDDLVEMAQAFMDAGFCDFGIMTDLNLNSLFVLAPAWNAYPYMFVNTDEGVRYSMVEPEMKDALAAWAEWYEDGILEEEWTARTWAGQGSGLLNNEVGIFPWYTWMGAMWGSPIMANQGKEHRLESYKIPSAIEGDPFEVMVRDQTSSYLVISKDCKNPEAAMQMANFYLWYNQDAVTDGSITLDEAEYMSKIYQCWPFQILDPSVTYERIRQTMEAIELGNTSKVTLSGVTQNLAIWERLQNPKDDADYISAWGSWAQLDAMSDWFYLEENNGAGYIKSAWYGAYPDVVNQYLGTLDGILREEFTKIIRGDKPLSYFDDVVERWYDEGGDQIIEAVNPTK